MDPAAARAQAEEFIERAQKVMVERSAPDIARFNEARLANLRRFERDIRLLANRFPSNQERQAMNLMITNQLRSIETNNNRMPPKLDMEFEVLAGAQQVLAEALRDQERVDAIFVEALNRQAGTYLTGLERELARLQQENIPPAADLIRREVERVKADPEYFPRTLTKVFPPDEKRAEEKAEEEVRSPFQRF